MSSEYPICPFAITNFSIKRGDSHTDSYYIISSHPLDSACRIVVNEWLSDNDPNHINAIVEDNKTKIEELQATLEDSILTIFEIKHVSRTKNNSEWRLTDTFTQFCRSVRHSYAVRFFVITMKNANFVWDEFLHDALASVSMTLDQNPPEKNVNVNVKAMLCSELQRKQNHYLSNYVNNFFDNINELRTTIVPFRTTEGVSPNLLKVDTYITGLYLVAKDRVCELIQDSPFHLDR